MVQFNEEGIVFASICLPSALLTLILSFYNETASSYGMYGWINKAQMSFQCDQQPPTHLPVNYEPQNEGGFGTETERNAPRWYLAFDYLHNTYSPSARCNR